MWMPCTPLQTSFVGPNSIEKSLLCFGELVCGVRASRTYRRYGAIQPRLPKSSCWISWPCGSAHLTMRQQAKCWKRVRWWPSPLKCFMFWFNAGCRLICVIFFGSRTFASRMEIGPTAWPAMTPWWSQVHTQIKGVLPPPLPPFPVSAIIYSGSRQSSLYKSLSYLIITGDGATQRNYCRHNLRIVRNIRGAHIWLHYIVVCWVHSTRRAGDLRFVVFYLAVWWWGRRLSDHHSRACR